MFKKKKEKQIITCFELGNLMIKKNIIPIPNYSDKSRIVSTPVGGYTISKRKIRRKITKF